MNFIGRVMRVMTHINLGAAPGLTARVLWTGRHFVTGPIVPTHRVAEDMALTGMAHTRQPAHMQLVPMHGAGGSLPPCHAPQPAPRQSAEVLSGAEQ